MHVVRNGGHLFDAYVTLLGSYSTLEKWNHYCTRKDQNGVIRMCSETESAEIIEAEKQHFLGFCMVQCARVASKSRTQLFFHTWNAVFHGLSRLGVHVLAQMGLMMKTSNFDTHRRQELDRTDQKLRFVSLLLCHYVPLILIAFSSFSNLKISTITEMSETGRTRCGLTTSTRIKASGFQT